MGDLMNILPRMFQRLPLPTLVSLCLKLFALLVLLPLLLLLLLPRRLQLDNMSLISHPRKGLYYLQFLVHLLSLVSRAPLSEISERKEEMET